MLACAHFKNIKTPTIRYPLKNSKKADSPLINPIGYFLYPHSVLHPTLPGSFAWPRPKWGLNSYRTFLSVSPCFLSFPCLPSNSKIPFYTPLLKWFFSNRFHQVTPLPEHLIFHKLLYKIPTCLAITSFTNRTTPSSNQTNTHHFQKHVSLCTLHNLLADFRKILKDFWEGSLDALSKECCVT